MITASGVGSWPGTDVRETVRMVRDLLADPGDGVAGLPYLPELPDRGPGADLVGRSLGLLVDLPVDLQPSGWRLTDRPGRDLSRAQSFLRQDLDELAEALDGYAGRLKLQVTGPWTLAAQTWLPRGERLATDEGAVRDLVASLAEGVRLHLAAVHRLLPGADIVLQVDEPSLPAVLEGRLPTASGFGTARAVDAQVVTDALVAVLAAAPSSRPVVHCCAAAAPVAVLRATGADLSLDTTLLGARQWESVAVAVEEGATLYAGSVATDALSPRPQAAADTLLHRWQDLGLPLATVSTVVVTPACGLAGLTPAGARDVQRVCVDTAREIGEAAAR